MILHPYFAEDCFPSERVGSIPLMLAVVIRRLECRLQPGLAAPQACIVALPVWRKTLSVSGAAIGGWAAVVENNLPGPPRFAAPNRIKRADSFAGRIFHRPLRQGQRA